jgi:gamma-glutamylcyclotransferase (GGCT)/AIG2-like uncharacterized protein YtfP
MSKFETDGPLSVEQLVAMARMSENAERFEDMIMFMRQRVTEYSSEPLTTEERNLMSVAYKNVIGARRASWRQFNYELENMAENTPEYDKIKKYEGQVAKEILEISENVLNLLEEKLIKKDAAITKENCEEQVFYLKMAGDYYRYLTESNPAQDYKDKCKTFYDDAYNHAKNFLQPTHPIRLGLALNYSVCYYEILEDKKKACDLAKEAFDSAISKLDALEESDYRDSTLIMQLLRDNLTLWTSSTPEQQQGDMRVEDVNTEQA